VLFFRGWDVLREWGLPLRENEGALVIRNVGTCQVTLYTVEQPITSESSNQDL
jgi:hypothetical protein